MSRKEVYRLYIDSALGEPIRQHDGPLRNLMNFLGTFTGLPSYQTIWRQINERGGYAAYVRRYDESLVLVRILPHSVLLPS